MSAYRVQVPGGGHPRCGGAPCAGTMSTPGLPGVALFPSSHSTARSVTTSVQCPSMRTRRPSGALMRAWVVVEPPGRGARPSRRSPGGRLPRCHLPIEGGRGSPPSAAFLRRRSAGPRRSEFPFCIEPVLVAVLAREDHGAARPADGVGAEGAPEDHALARQLVDAGRGVHARESPAVRPDGVGGVVVGEDKEDIGAFGGGGGADGGDAEEGAEGESGEVHGGLCSGGRVVWQSFGMLAGDVPIRANDA